VTWAELGAERARHEGDGGGFGGGVAVQWRCHLPDRDVTQVAGHREPAIEQGDPSGIPRGQVTERS